MNELPKPDIDRSLAKCKGKPFKVTLIGMSIPQDINATIDNGSIFNLPPSVKDERYESSRSNIPVLYEIKGNKCKGCPHMRTNKCKPKTSKPKTGRARQNGSTVKTKYFDVQMNLVR